MLDPRQRPLLAYYALVFALTLPLYALSLASGLELLPKLPLSALSVVCPAGAALLCTWRADGAHAARRLAARAWDVARVRGAPLAILGVLAAPAAHWASYGVPALFHGSASVTPLSPGRALGLCAMFLIGGVAEELGWTGYAVERRITAGTLRAGLEVGVVWASWHVIPLLDVGRSLQFIGLWTIGTIALRIVLVWLYEISGHSVFAAAVSHGLRNLVWMLIPIYGSRYDAGTDAVATALLALTVLALAPGRVTRTDSHSP